MVVTREPGGTPLGEAIRHLLKHDPAVRDMCSHAELLLFLASRAELVRKVILPALDTGAWVLSDRFLDSTTVYQGAGRKLPLEIVDRINAFAVGPNLPGLTLILDLEPAESKKRVQRRTNPIGGFDRMEEQPPDFFEARAPGFIATWPLLIPNGSGWFRPAARLTKRPRQFGRKWPPRFPCKLPAISCDYALPR